jgi:hypothetical protein
MKMWQEKGWSSDIIHTFRETTIWHFSTKILHVSVLSVGKWHMCLSLPNYWLDDQNHPTVGCRQEPIRAVELLMCFQLKDLDPFELSTSNSVRWIVWLERCKMKLPKITISWQLNHMVRKIIGREHDASTVPKKMHLLPLGCIFYSPYRVRSAPKAQYQ